MQLQHCFAAGSLMQSINILRDDCFQFAFLFPLGKLFMRSVWFCVRRQHLGTVKPVKFFRILPKKGMA